VPAGKFFFGHGQISNRVYSTIRRQCPEDTLRSGNMSVTCQKMTEDALNNVGRYYDYNLYDMCGANTFGASRVAHHKLLRWMPAAAAGAGARTKRQQPSTAPGARTGYYCDGNALAVWIARSDVRRALGVSVNATFFK
jgi:hypothetical protein